MQKDMFEPKQYWYDLTSDPANLGMERDVLKVGDTFVYAEINGLKRKYEIVEQEDFNQMWLIEEVENE